MIDEKNFLINQLKMIRKHYTTGCFLDYNYFKNHHKMIAIELSKQQALDADPKAMQEINFTGNLRGRDNRVMFSIIEEAKKTILDFSQRL